MALVAAARAALNAAVSVADRRAGRAASDQEPEGPVRADLAELRAELADHVARLRLRAAVGVPEPAAAALAQAFEDRVLLDDTARTLARVHQKLLSLFPAVEAPLVEAVRLSAQAAANRAVADDHDRDLAGFASRLAGLADHLRGALDGDA